MAKAKTVLDTTDGITFRELLNAVPVIEKLLALTIEPLLMIKLSKWVSEINDKVKPFYTVRAALYNKYIGEGVEYGSASEKQQGEYNSAVNEAVEDTVVISANKIPISMLQSSLMRLDKHTITGGDFINIAFMFEE